MTNAEQIIENLIIGLRDGKGVCDTLEEPETMELLNDEENCNLSQEEAIKIALHVVYDLYDGKFPIDHLMPGDLCIDAFGCRPCIITHVSKNIHVLYFNGKTHRFFGWQEKDFKKLGVNVYSALNDLLDVAVAKADNERFNDGIDFEEEHESA